MVGASPSAGRQRAGAARPGGEGPGPGRFWRGYTGLRRGPGLPEGEGESPSHRRGPGLPTGQRVRPQQGRQRGVGGRGVAGARRGAGAARLPRGQALLPLAQLGDEVALSCRRDARGYTLLMGGGS